MARHYGANQANRWNIDAASAFTWAGPWTCAFVIKRVANGGYFVVATYTSGLVLRSACEIITDDSGGNLAYFYDATSSGFSASTTTVLAADGWTLVVVTKAASGNTTPRFHFYKWPANSWVHENGSAAVNPVTSVGAGGHFIVEASTTAVNQSSDVAAAMILTNRGLTDSECLRLPKGRWSEYITRGEDFLIEYQSGRDTFVASTVTNWDIGRSRRRGNLTQTDTRAANADPPGFRFSAISRRI